MHGTGVRVSSEAMASMDGGAFSYYTMVPASAIRVKCMIQARSVLPEDCSSSVIASIPNRRYLRCLQVLQSEQMKLENVAALCSLKRLPEHSGSIYVRGDGQAAAATSGDLISHRSSMRFLYV